MRIMRKGQAAMEFLMTYGWAILVVLIAIGALAYFGVLSPDKFLPEKCVITTGSGLFCSNFNVDTGTTAADGTVTLQVKNSLADQVVITGATSALKEGGVSQCVASDLTLAADGSGNLVFTDCGLVSGDKLKWDISIGYTVGTGVDAFAKSTTGSLIAKAP